MQPRDWLPLLGYGALAATLLACLWLISLAPMRSQWGRELMGAAVAIIAMAVGVGLARRPSARTPSEPVAPVQTPSSAREPDLARSESATGTTQPSAAAGTLSVREQEVLRLLSRGLSNKELARELSVSENTVKTHLANLYAKLGARRRTEALAAARRMGVDLPA